MNAIRRGDPLPHPYWQENGSCTPQICVPLADWSNDYWRLDSRSNGWTRVAEAVGPARTFLVPNESPATREARLTSVADSYGGQP